MINYLPYPTARRLYDAGVRIESENVYVVVGGTVREFTAEEAKFYVGCYKEEKQAVQVVPRPTFCELLALLPSAYSEPDFTASYQFCHYIEPTGHLLRYEHRQNRAVAPLAMQNENPVEAAGLLLLLLIEKGIVTVNEN